MPLQYSVGTRVFHKGCEANGIITEVDCNKYKDKYKVEFIYAKWADVKHENEEGDKWQWCSESQLIPGEYYSHEFCRIRNHISMIGRRYLDKLIQQVCEIPLRQPYDGSEIIINYGIRHSISTNIRVLNRSSASNKFTQCRKLGSLVPMTTRTLPPRFKLSNWIKKPQYSRGGRGIYFADSTTLNKGEYFQEFFPKVREFRAHCFMWMDEPVPLIQEKIVEDKSVLCWNKQQGGEFKHCYQPKLNYGAFNNKIEPFVVSDIINKSCEALYRLGMDFGGIDFGMNDKGELKIFEVNKRMNLRERALYAYKDAFQSLKIIRWNKLHRR